MTDERIRLDLNAPSFQRSFFRLSNSDIQRLRNTLRKLSRMSWQQLYRDPGLRWEAIRSHTGPQGEALYSLRVSRKFRAVVCREPRAGLRLLSLHPDHDSAYD